MQPNAGPVDRAIETMGLRRTNVTVVPDFAGAILLLQQTEHVLTALGPPLSRSAKALGLEEARPPVELASSQPSLAWRARMDGDAGHESFRRIVRTELERACGGPRAR